jgi:hypothetical protein
MNLFSKDIDFIRHSQEETLSSSHFRIDEIRHRKKMMLLVAGIEVHLFPRL